jgi:hypothetical protein
LLLVPGSRFIWLGCAAMRTTFPGSAPSRANKRLSPTKPVI